MRKGPLFCLFSGVLLSALMVCPIIAAEPAPQQDMKAAQEDMEKAQQMFKEGAQAPAPATSPSSGQKNGQSSWSEAAGGKSSRGSSINQNDPRESALQGSPETGYAGTWTDPATGDIITSVIAPTPRPDSYQSTPIIVEPQVAPGWGNYNNSGWQQNSWPVSPDSPGYPDPGFQQPPSAGGPGYNPYGGGYNYPAPPGGYYNPGFYPPPNFHPNYRPLRPQPGANRPVPPQPGQNGAIWNPNRPVYPSEGGARPPQPEYNIPGWKPFPPEGNQAVPPRPGFAGYPQQPEYNIPGWKPFPPANNQAWPSRPGWSGMRPNGPRPPKGF